MPSVGDATPPHTVSLLGPQDLPNWYEGGFNERSRIASTTINGIVLYVFLDEDSRFPEVVLPADGGELPSVALVDSTSHTPSLRPTPEVCCGSNSVMETIAAAAPRPICNVIVEFTSDAPVTNIEKTFCDSLSTLSPINLAVGLPVMQWHILRRCLETLSKRTAHFKLCCELTIAFLNHETNSNLDGTAQLQAAIAQDALSHDWTDYFSWLHRRANEMRTQWVWSLRLEVGSETIDIPNNMGDSHGMKLDYDILILVSHLLITFPEDIRDLSAMSRTCKHLYRECVPILLGPREVSVHGDSHIESFCRFILSDINRRVDLLSRCPLLDFGGDAPLSEPVTDILIEMLGHITSLRRLSFHRFEEFMSPSSRVFRVLAAFPGTRYLDITLRSFPGKWSYAKFLKETRAPLKDVRLSFRDHDTSTRKNMGYVRYNRNLDPIWLFSSLSSTLESLVLDGRFTAEACSVIHVYPHLVYFAIHHRCMPLLRPYIQAFPSLQGIQFNLVAYAWTTHLMPTEDVQEVTLRNKKSEDLRRHNREDQLAHGSWPELRFFMGMTLDAYIAGITCRIHNLHLIAWGGSMEAEVAAMCAVFMDARPSTFRLAIRPQHVEYLASLFSQRLEVFSSLPTLEIRLDVTEAPFDFNSYLDGIGIALQHLHITSLKIEIKCWAQYATRYWDRFPGKKGFCDKPWVPKSGPAQCYTLDALSHEDMHGRLQYFLEKIRTLRRVTIAWGRCRVNYPHRFITLDLDNVPHMVDRPGKPTDRLWYTHYRV